MPRKSRTSNRTSWSTSPFASSFKSGIKSGTPCNSVISNIAKRTNKSVSTIVKSLSHAGLCFCQKFNGTWICWPTFNCRTSASKSSNCQTAMWQSFIDWCCMTGCCTPSQLSSKSGAQKSFMSSCRSMFGKQVRSSGSSSSQSRSKRRRSSGKSRSTSISRKTRWTAKHRRSRSRKTGMPSRFTSTRSYAFPSYGSRWATRRYVRAA